MKNLFLPLLLFLLLLTHDLRAQGISLSCDDGHGGTIRATWQRPLPQGNQIHDVCFVDNRIGWAVGDYGSILQTRDGGRQWSSIASGTVNDFSSVSFISDSVGWICGRISLLATTDGGKHWRSYDCPRKGNLSNAMPITVQMLSDKTIALLTNEGVWRSRDRGETWDYRYDVYDPMCMQFTDARHGWVAGARWRTARTTDGGETWTEHWAIGEGFGAYGIHFMDSLNGMTFDDRQVFLSSDGGRSWTRAADSIAAAAQRDSLLRFLDGSSSGIRDTTALAWLRSVSFVSKDCGWAVGDGVFHTLDGGEHWHRQFDAGDFPLNRVFFLNEKRGWAVGNGGRLLSTTDAGAHWADSRVNEAGDSRLMGIVFLNERNGWIVGEKGGVFSTADAGRSWRKRDVPTSEFLTDITFLNDRIGYCIGLVGTFVKTTDGGATWRSSSFGRETTIADMAVLNDSCVLLLARKTGKNSLVLRSTNGGDSWMAQTISDNDRSAAVLLFQDGIHGTILFHDGSVLRTDDAGISWQPLPVLLGLPLTDAAIASPRRMFLVGSHGCIMRIDLNPSTKGE